MALTKCILGKHIELRGEINSHLTFGIDDVRGVNNLKQLMSTKADLNGRDLSKFQIVHPGEFVFNHRTSRNGSKFSIAYNDGEKPIICTEDYVVFRVKKESEKSLSAKWLYMYFNRSEFDRYVITNSWGSSTEFYNWEDLCEIELELPDFPVQQQYVDIYNAMVTNQQSYERGLDDLKLVLDATIEQFKYNYPRIPLSEITNESDERNLNLALVEVKGVSKDKAFMPAVASGEDLSKYKIVRKNHFACNLMHVGRDVVVPVALHTDEMPLIVSPAYVVFGISNKRILPEYLLIWLSRTETDRYAWFMCDNNIRGGMEKKRFFEMDIPVPSISEQKALVELYEVLSLRRTINEKLKTQIKDICPILIRGSLENGG